MGRKRNWKWRGVFFRSSSSRSRAGSPPVITDGTRAREEAASWLILLDDDPLDPEQQARFRAWLAADPQHAVAWASVSRTGELLAVAPPASRPQARRRSRALRFGAAAAGMVVAAGLVSAVMRGRLVRMETDEVTGTAEIRTVRLDDGSSVRLGPETAITVSYVDDKRSVKLVKGEALFDVQHDPTRPFQVIVRDAVITDIGTRFNVNMRGEATAVTVNHGQVRVADGRQSHLLNAGDWVRLDAAGAASQGAGLPDDFTAGPSHRIVARNAPVASVVDDLRPWFAGRIMVPDAEVGARLVTGVFDAANPVTALQALVGPVGGRVVQWTPLLLIVTRADLGPRGH